MEEVLKKDELRFDDDVTFYALAPFCLSKPSKAICCSDVSSRRQIKTCSAASGRGDTYIKAYTRHNIQF